MDKVFVQTFGCQMNVYDSRRMLQLLAAPGAATGATEVSTPEAASVILINTCSVRAKPEAKVRSTLGRYAQLRRDNPDLIIVVTGCVAQQLGDSLAGGPGGADLVVGPDRIAALPDLIAAVRAAREPRVATETAPVADYPFVAAEPTAEDGLQAMLTVMKGCDNFCAYCIVPLVRGREVSKPLAQVVGEAERLIAAGAKEILLLGQNVNRYRDPAGTTFPALLHAVGHLPGLSRLRFTTSHPRDCGDDLIACFDGCIPTLCEYFHLPFQAGADTVLERMRRGYTNAHYRALVGKLRAVCPDIHLSADVIVGFPGESDADFAETLRLLDDVGFGSLFAFKYSPRPGTLAATYDDSVPAAEKARRLAAVLDLQAGKTQAFLDAHVGRTVSVLVEGESKRAARGKTQLTGRTRDNAIVHFASPADDAAVSVGAVVPVVIERALKHSLVGRVVADGCR